MTHTVNIISGVIMNIKTCLFFVLVVFCSGAAFAEEKSIKDMDQGEKCETYTSITRQILIKLKNQEDVPKEECQLLYKLYADKIRCECVDTAEMKLAVEKMLIYIQATYKLLYDEELGLSEPCPEKPKISIPI
jgi:hypothetical protein